MTGIALGPGDRSRTNQPFTDDDAPSIFGWLLGWTGADRMSGDVPGLPAWL